MQQKQLTLLMRKQCTLSHEAEGKRRGWAGGGGRGGRGGGLLVWGGGVGVVVGVRAASCVPPSIMPCVQNVCEPCLHCAIAVCTTTTAAAPLSVITNNTVVAIIINIPSAQRSFIIKHLATFHSNRLPIFGRHPPKHPHPPTHPNTHLH